MAKQILSEPQEIQTMSGLKLPLKMQVDYISFSAHTDYKQTSGFIRELKPPHVVLVHGEANEMNRLKSALTREYEADPETKINFYKAFIAKHECEIKVTWSKISKISFIVNLDST